MSRIILYSTLFIMAIFFVGCTQPNSNGCDAGERVQFHVNVSLEDGDQSGFVKFEIPKGKRFLIKHLTADVRVPKGQRTYLMLACRPVLDPPTGGLSAHHHFPLTPQGANISTGPGMENHLTAQVTDLFCDQELSILIVRGPAPNPQGIGGGRIAFSGWLVDLPTE